MLPSKLNQFLFMVISYLCFIVHITIQAFREIFTKDNLYILCLSVCQSVRLYPINVQTAEPIEPKFEVGPR